LTGKKWSIWWGLGQFVGRRLNRVAVIMHLDERAPVGGRAPGGREEWSFKRLAEMREDCPYRARPCDERDELDVAAAFQSIITSTTTD